MTGRKIHFFLILLLSGCTFRKIEIQAVSNLLKNTEKAIMMEENIELVKEAFPSIIILMNGLINAIPDNPEIFLHASITYCSYAFAFLEEEPEIAGRFYEKGREYALKALKFEKNFEKALKKGNSLEDSLKQIKNKRFIPPLFWFTLCNLLFLETRLDDPEAVWLLPEAKSGIEVLYHLDDRYFYGGAHLLSGIYFSMLPLSYGGGVEKAEREFTKALEISGGKMFIQNVLFAKYYAVTLDDEELFERELIKVINTPADILPEMRFLNSIAKLKARKMLQNKRKIFKVKEGEN